MKYEIWSFGGVRLHISTAQFEYFLPKLMQIQLLVSGVQTPNYIMKKKIKMLISASFNAFEVANLRSGKCIRCIFHRSKYSSVQQLIQKWKKKRIKCIWIYTFSSRIRRTVELSTNEHDSQTTTWEYIWSICRQSINRLQFFDHKNTKNPKFYFEISSVTFYEFRLSSYYAFESTVLVQLDSICTSTHNKCANDDFWQFSKH